MPMTRKDFELIACALRNAKPELHGQLDYAESCRERGWLQATHAVTDALATTNSGFNRARFLQACGVRS